MLGVVTSDNGIRAGIEMSVLRQWSKDPKKGKLAAKLLRIQALSMDEYMALEDGKSLFWNDRGMVELYLATGLDMYGISASISIHPKTINKYLKEGNKKVESRLLQLKKNMGV